MRALLLVCLVSGCYDFDALKGQRLRWDQSTNVALYHSAVFGRGPNELWISGWTPSLLHSFDRGHTWFKTDYSAPAAMPPSPRLVGMGDIWTDGRLLVMCGDLGSIVVSTDDGATLSTVTTTADLSKHFYALAGTSQSDLVVVGDTGYFMFFDGTAWSMSPQSGAFVAAWARAPNDLYVVGLGGMILRGSGDTWRQLPVGSSNVLYGIWGTTQEIFVVGDRGLVLYSSNQGEDWQPRNTGVSATLRAVWGAAGVVYAAGDEGTILRTSDSGLTWQKETPVTLQSFRGLWGTSPTDVWAVGDAQTVLHGHL